MNQFVYGPETMIGQLKRQGFGTPKAPGAVKRVCCAFITELHESVFHFHLFLSEVTIETFARSDEKISLDQQRQRHYYQVTMPQVSLMALCLNFFKYYIIT